MKRILNLCLLLLAMCLQANADTITAEQAKSMAQTFLGSQNETKKTSAASAQLTLKAQLSDCYLFSRGTNAGFVLVAADDMVAQPILGYADEGTIDMQNLPCNLKWWLAQYAKQMEWARQHGITTAAQVKKAPVVTKAEVRPFVKTKWNQDTPYNNQCPTIGSTQCPTGCVATAMSQIMKYYEYPTKGTGSKTITVNSSSYSRTFSDHTYDWDNMLLVYGSSYTTTEASAVATLMADAGYSVSMQYATGGSGAYNTDVVVALKDNFSYSKSIKYLSRDSYGLTEWTETIYNELVNDRPVYYSGSNDEGGHAFVLDGYKSGYFHVNWGWGGSSDGYFLISALDPSEQGIGGSSSGYNNGQEAIIGIQPATDHEDSYVEVPKITIEDFATRSQTVERSGSFSFSANASDSYIWNMGEITWKSPVMGLKVVDEKGNATYLQCSGGFGDIEKYYVLQCSYINVPLSNFPTDQSQTYKVYPVFKHDGGDTWYDMTVTHSTTSSNQNYLTATTDGTKVYFTTPTFSVSLSASDIELPAVIFAGKEFTVKAKISAVGGEYNGDVYAVPDGETAYSASVNVDASTSATIGFSCTAPSTAGTQTLAIYDKDYKKISDDISYTVTAVPTSDLALTISDVQFVNTASDDLHVKVTVSCTGGYLDDTIYGFVFPSSGGSSIGYATGNLLTWDGQTTTFELEGTLSNGTAGTGYMMAFYRYANGSMSQISSSAYTFTLTAAGTQVAQSSYDNIGNLIDAAYALYKQEGKTVSSNNRPQLKNVGLNFAAGSNPATVVAVLQYQDTNEGKESDVDAGYIFVVDESERGMMLIPSTNTKNRYDLSALKVGDVITGTLAGSYSEKMGIPTFEVRGDVSQGSGSSKVTITSDIQTNTDGEATDTEEATYPVSAVPNIYYLAKTNEKDVDGNDNVGDVTKQAYGNYLNTIITVKGTIREKNGNYFLLQNEDDAVDDADLTRIYFTADEFPDINLADYVGTTGTFEGLLIKRNIAEAKLSVMKKNFFQVEKLYISELDDETRVSDLADNGSLANEVDIYVHRTKLVTTGDNAYTTICLPFDMTASEFKDAFGCDISLLAEATSTVTDGHQQLRSVESKSISAGTPYVLKATGTQTMGNGSQTTDANYWAHIGTKTISVSEPKKVEASYDTEIINGTFYFCGLYGKKQYTTGSDGKPTTTLIADGGSEKYQYISTTDGMLRYLPKDSQLAFNGLRAYYYFPSWSATNNDAHNSGTTNKSLKLVIGTPTSIDGITIDGLQESEAPVYNLSGQLVSHSRQGLAKGLYIQNGKKFAIK